MSIIGFSAAGALQIDNGAAYGAIAGGAITFIPDHLRWYTGENYSAYVAMLTSKNLDVWEVVALLAIRGAVKNAAANAATELGRLAPAINAGQPNVGRLQLNPAEQMDDNAMLRMINVEKLDLAEWNAPDAAPDAPMNIVRVAEGYRRKLTAPAMEAWAKQVAQMSYTIIADNGYGLIVAAHHFRGQAENAANNTLKMYGLDKVTRDLGLVPKDVTIFLFHDILHPLAYEAVANLANAPPAGFSSKVAATVLKRLPAFPGGTTHVQRAVTVRRVLQGHARLSAPLNALWGKDVDNALDDLQARIMANPLDFNAQFRPQQATANKAAVEKIVPYCALLFGIYDGAFPPRRGEEATGPTRGPGIRKLIEENVATYQAAFEAATAFIATSAAPTLASLLASIVEAFDDTENEEVPSEDEEEEAVNA
jgi:hypothetical protein